MDIIIKPHEYSDAKLEKFVTSISDEMLEGEHTPNTQFATGGIVTKLKAADFFYLNIIFLCI